MNGFDKELHVATVATATIVINYANDVAEVWDRVVQHYQLIISVTDCSAGVRHVYVAAGA